MADFRVKLGVDIDTKGIDSKINNYKGKAIEVKTKLDTSGIDKKLSGYKARKPIEIQTKLNTTGIVKKIGELKPKTPIKLSAKLDTKSVNAAVKNVQAKPIKIDVKLNTKNINQQLKGFKTTSPIKINTKLDTKSINQQIRGYNSPNIKINAKINKKDVDTVIKNYKPKPIKLDAEIKKTALNKQINDFTPRTTIKLKASLQKGAIADEIRKYKPTAPIKVDLEAELMPESITKIDGQIESHKTNSKIKVGVKLDKQDVNAEVKGLPKPTETIKVDVELNKTSVNSAITSTVPASPLKVGVDLQTNDVNSQIEKITPTSKIKVYLDLADGNVGSDAGKQNLQNPIQVNVKLDRDDINTQLKNFKTTSKIKVGVKLDFASHKDDAGNEIQKGISKQIKEYNGKTKVRIGVELDRNSISQEVQNIQVDTPIQLRVELDPAGVQNVRNQIDNLRQEIQALDNININIGGNGNGGGRGGRRQVDEATQAYRELMGVLGELNLKRLQLNGLDASSPESSNKIQRLRLQIEQLENEYNNLLNSFNAQGIQFTADQWNELETVIARVGRQIDVVQAGMSDKSAINQQTQTYKELLSISKEMGSLELNLTKLRSQGGNTNQITELENQLDTLRMTYQQLVTSMDTPLTSEQWSSLNLQIAKTQDKIAILQARYVDVRTDLARNISVRLDNGTFDNDISNITSKFEKLQNKSVEMRTAMGEVNSALSRMHVSSETGNVDNLINAYEDYVRALRAVKNQLDINSRTEKDAASAQKLADESAAFQSKIDAWLTKNSAAAEKFGSAMLELRAQAESCDKVTLDHLKAQFNQLDAEAGAAGLKMQTFGDKIKEQFKKYSAYFGVAELFMYAEQGLRSMFEQVKSIDTAMTELKKVTNETDASYNQFLSNAAQRSKEIGTTIDGLVSSTADFARLGYSFKESQGLAEVANIYAVVGDEIDGVEGATQSLVSTLAAFKGEIGDMSNDEFALSIVDKMNEVANNYAISSGGIGEALQRSASSMAAANNTLDETIAMITAANEVAQDPEKVGKWLCRLKKWLYRLNS